MSATEKEVITTEFEKVPMSQSLKFNLLEYFETVKKTSENLPILNKAIFPASMVLERVFYLLASTERFNHEEVCMAIFSFVDMVMREVLTMIEKCGATEEEKKVAIQNIQNYFKHSILVKLAESEI